MAAPALCPPVAFAGGLCWWPLLLPPAPPPPPPLSLRLSLECLWSTPQAHCEGIAWSISGGFSSTREGQPAPLPPPRPWLFGQGTVPRVMGLREEQERLRSQEKQGCEDAESLKLQLEGSKGTLHFTDKGRGPGRASREVTAWGRSQAGLEPGLRLPFACSPGGGRGLRPRVSAGAVPRMQPGQAQSQARPAVSDVLGVRQAEVRRGSPAPS